MEGHEKLQFYYLWIFANLIAFVLAALIADEVSGFLLRHTDATSHGFFILDARPYALVNGVIFGLVLGVTEWLFLRQPIGLSKRWIIISIIAWDLSALFWAFLEDVPALDNTMTQGMLAGALLGLIQWVYLRRISHRVRWWIVGRMISGIFVFSTIVYTSAPIGTGFVNGLITGIAAALLLPSLPTTVMPIALEEQLQ